MVFALLLVATTAEAQELQTTVVRRDDPRWLVSVPLLGLDRASVVIQGEHYLTPRVTVLTSLGGRWPDAGDYDARALVGGLGARWFFFPYHRGGGAFFAARLDLTRRWLIDDVDNHSLGHTYALSGSLLAGWRLILWRHLELTPELGAVTSREWTSVLPSRTQTGLAVGITLGWLF
jgi:hypothetical protein